MRDHIQAYLDGLNIRANVLGRANERVSIYENLHQDPASGTFTYTVDGGLTCNAIRIMDGDRVLVYMDFDPHTGEAGEVLDTTLAEHFRSLMLEVLEDLLYTAQDIEVGRLGGVVLNSGWGTVDCEDYVSISSKTDIGIIKSRYTYATRKTEHEWD